MDYEETFLPVRKHSSLRLQFAMATKHNLDIDHMDAVTAVLQGELEEEIYVKQLPGLEIEEKKNIIYRLNNAM